MRVTVTGATGLVGRALVARLRSEGAHVTALSRDPARALQALGVPAAGDVPAATEERVQVHRWDPLHEPAPPAALEEVDAIVNLAGEPLAQRWTAHTRQAIRESRVLATRHLLDGLRAAGWSQERPPALVSASAIGWYGPHGEEPLDEEAPAGRGFLAEVCVAWEAEARRAQEEWGLRCVQVRTGVVLDRHGGALAQMLPPFRLGLGGPVAGGRQYVSWIHLEDLLGILHAACAQQQWSGPINATAPEPVTNRELAHALGRALHRPAVFPLPAAALRLRYGAMAQLITTGARVLPARPLMWGYEFRYAHLDEALRATLAGR
jgi:uncharacterized protein (TIGR01777 family)